METIRPARCVVVVRIEALLLAGFKRLNHSKGLRRGLAVAEPDGSEIRRLVDVLEVEAVVGEIGPVEIGEVSTRGNLMQTRGDCRQIDVATLRWAAALLLRRSRCL